MVPRSHTTHGKTRSRRAHHALKKTLLGLCAKCSQPVLPHRVCLNCGYYQGREVVNVLAKLEKKERKKREKEMAEQKRQGEKAVGEEKSLTMAGLSHK